MVVVAFPGTYSAVREITLRTALHTRLARDIARKAGLKRGASPTEIGARSVASANVDPTLGEPYLYQWVVDLTQVTHIRLWCPSSQYVYLLGSTTISEALDPGDYEVIAGTWDAETDFWVSSSLADEEVNLYWVELAEEHRVPMRLIISTDPTTPLLNVSTAFSVMVEVK